MRKTTISIIAAGLAIGVAAPASAHVAPNHMAQYYPVPTYKYQPYNYNYGWNAGSFAQSMQGRVQRIRADIRNMHARRILSSREFRDLDKEAMAVERRIYRKSRGGVTPAEARQLEQKIQRLERHVMREATDWNNRYGRRRH